MTAWHFSYGDFQHEPAALAARRGAMKIRVLIADDHPVVRKGLRACLARQANLNVIGEASDGEEALSKTRELAPDVVLMYLSMPAMNGLAVTELLRKEAPHVKV